MKTSYKNSVGGKEGGGGGRKQTSKGEDKEMRKEKEARTKR